MLDLCNRLLGRRHVRVRRGLSLSLLRRGGGGKEKAMADARPAPWRAPRRRRGSFIADSRRRTAPVEPPMLASVMVAPSGPVTVGVLAWPRCVATLLDAFAGMMRVTMCAILGLVRVLVVAWRGGARVVGLLRILLPHLHATASSR